MGDASQSLSYDPTLDLRSPSATPEHHGASPSGRRISDIHIPSPDYSACIASSEHFDKSGLIVAQEAALHDAAILEMGYHGSEADGYAWMPEGEQPKSPAIGTLQDLKCLKPIRLRNLKIGKVHRGRILSGTLCCKSVKIFAVMNVLEEEGTGDATKLVISNAVPRSATTATAQRLYPENAQLSVREPYLKRFVDGMVGLLVENPTDIIFNYLPDEIPSPVSERENLLWPVYKDQIGDGPDTPVFNTYGSFLSSPSPLSKSSLKTLSSPRTPRSPRTFVDDPLDGLPLRTIRKFKSFRTQDEDDDDVKESFDRKDTLETSRFARGKPSAGYEGLNSAVGTVDRESKLTSSHPVSSERPEDSSVGNSQDVESVRARVELFGNLISQKDRAVEKPQDGCKVESAVPANNVNGESAEAPVEQLDDSAVSAPKDCKVEKPQDDYKDETAVPANNANGEIADASVEQLGESGGIAPEDCAVEKPLDCCQEEAVVHANGGSPEFPVKHLCGSVGFASAESSGCSSKEPESQDSTSEDATSSHHVETDPEATYQAILAKGISDAEETSDLQSDSFCSSRARETEGSYELSDQDAQLVKHHQGIPEAQARSESELERSLSKDKTLDVDPDLQLSESKLMDGHNAQGDAEGEGKLDVVPETQNIDEGVVGREDSPALEDRDVTASQNTEYQNYNNERRDTEEKPENGKSTDSSVDQSVEPPREDEIGVGVEKRPEGAHAILVELIEQEEEIRSSVGTPEKIKDELINIISPGHEKLGEGSIEAPDSTEPTDSMRSVIEDKLEVSPKAEVDFGEPELKSRSLDTSKACTDSIHVSSEATRDELADDGCKVTGAEAEVGVPSVSATKSEDSASCTPPLSNGENRPSSDAEQDHGASSSSPAMGFNLAARGRELEQDLQATAHSTECASQPVGDEDLERKLVGSSDAYQSCGTAQASSGSEATSNVQGENGMRSPSETEPGQAARDLEVDVSVATITPTDVSKHSLSNGGSQPEGSKSEKTGTVTSTVPGNLAETETGDSNGSAVRELHTETKKVDSSGSAGSELQTESRTADSNGSATSESHSESNSVDSNGSASVGNHAGSKAVDSNGSAANSSEIINAVVEEELTAAALRIKGNQRFARQDWMGAIELYTRAIHKAVHESKEQSASSNGAHHVNGSGVEIEMEVVMDYSNRAEAWLRLHHYERAWADAERALSVDPHHLKSLFRKGRALLGVGDYQQALTHLESAYARAPFDRDLLAAIKLSRIGDHQSRLGIFELSDYYLRGRFAGETPTCADYVGPVQVKAASGDKGRGLFLTRHVEAGDLLLVSNPLAMLDSDHGNKIRKSSLDTCAKGRLEAELENKLVQAVRERAKVSTKNRRRLLALSHGGENADQPVPSMDLFIPGKRIAPVETQELDEERVRSIVVRNAVERNMVATSLEKRHELPRPDAEAHDDRYFLGLWVLPSFMNHSCIPNVSLVVIGRALFVYASRDLGAGEELVCSYFNVFQPLPQRREISSRCWGFTCKCARCLLETRFESSLKRLYSLHSRLEPHPEFVLQFSPLGYKAPAKDLAKELEVIEGSKKLDQREKCWLQASFTQLYTVSRDFMGPHGNYPYMESALKAMEVVCPGSTSTLEVGLLVRETARKEFHGKKTSHYKVINQQVLRLCQCIYGKQKAAVLQSIVDGVPLDRIKS